MSFFHGIRLPSSYHLLLFLHSLFTTTSLNLSNATTNIKQAIPNNLDSEFDNYVTWTTLFKIHTPRLTWFITVSFLPPQDHPKLSYDTMKELNSLLSFDFPST